MQLTVLICTYNRAYAILDCLRSVERSLQNAAPVDAEILVIDNASTDNTAATIKAWAATCAIPVNLVYEAKKGLAAARNCGLRNARGELIIFTDDDCRLSDTYIVEALRHDAADGAELVLRGGRVELGDPTDLPMTVKTVDTIQRWQRSLDSARLQNMASCFPGCNMMMRRILANKIGIFDEKFGAGTDIPGGEDTDYFYRAYILNYLLEYVPDMIIYHFHGRKSALDGYKLMRNYCIGSGALFAKYSFKFIDFCRPFSWDFRGAVREIKSGKNLFMPEIGMSFRDKIYFYFLGAARYLRALALS